MEYLRIRNWMKYQSIQGKNAPYVTLQTSILLDMEFMSLPDRERLCFLLLMAFAGVSQNKIPDDQNHVMYLCHMDEQPNLDLMVERGLLESWCPDKHQQMIDNSENKLKSQRDRQRKSRAKKVSHSNVTRDRHVTNKMSHVETETETETETDTKTETEKRPCAPSGARFDEWYAQYPKKKGKAAALKTWKRKKLDRHADEIIADTIKRAEIEWKDPQFIPMASTYINQERWHDEDFQPRTNSAPKTKAEEREAYNKRQNEIAQERYGDARH